ncbi:MAG TPA: hypothetical protein VHQ94_05950 [Pyrinomonadaceae bacterium]|jgi:hypothetical protein|nr:hypothetical protein [Pyrinomonadaceae bacterium]
MPQDPFERVQVFLSESKVNPLALLLDLTTLLPEELLQRALWLATYASEEALRAFLIQALAKRLTSKAQRIELTNNYPIPGGTQIKEVSTPEGKEAKRLIGKLSEQQRYKAFNQILDNAEMQARAGMKASARPVEEKNTEPSPVPDELFGDMPRGGGDVSSKSTIGSKDVKSVEDEGGFESFEPPVSTGGGGAAASDAGYDPGGGEPQAAPAYDDDDGFESVTVPVTSSEPPPAPPPSGETSERPDLVNLGFSQQQPADTRLKKDEPLQTGHSYYFWIRIGKDVDEAAIGTPSEIDLTEIKKLFEEPVLTVAIFNFEKELEISPGRDIGELKIRKDGKVKVLRQPLDTNLISLSAAAPAGYLDDYLLFPISVPIKEATYRLRCNIYCAQVLVQSYVVSANVRSTSDPVPEACSQRLDYFLSQSLRADHLASITKEPHLLSLMVNDNGDGSSTFRFFGSDGTERYKDDAPIDGPQLSGFLQQARAALRKVSWGDEEEWDEKKGAAYRYKKGEKFDEKKLAKDLAYLARAGSRIYTGFQIHLHKKRSELEALLANSGLIQIALKLSPRAVLPAAVVYDYGWNPNQFNFPTTEFQLCPTFSKALNEAQQPDGPTLEDAACFNGGCELKQMIADIQKPGSGKTMSSLGPIICPSGFWGYRHLLGLPLTLDGSNNEIPPVIEFKDSLQMFSCVSTDPGFVERDPHLANLKALQGLKLERDNGYDPFILRLKSSVPQLIYFYCHGGVKAGSFNPYLQIGDKDELDPNNWGFEGIEWTGPNPLVFINGCHTVSLNPEVTLDFVSSFVQTSGAAGVIGTEITIFEPLAVRFAEECFKRFIGAAPHKEKMPIGKAVRGARLALLRDGNPLGLVYIPYAVASLRLQEAH